MPPNTKDAWRLFLKTAWKYALFYIMIFRLENNTGICFVHITIFGLETAQEYALFTLRYLDLKIAQEYIIHALFMLQYLDSLLGHCFWNQLRYMLCLHYDNWTWNQLRYMLCFTLWHLDLKTAQEYALFTLWYLDLKTAQEYALFYIMMFGLENSTGICFVLHYDIWTWKQHRNMLCLHYNIWYSACTQECCLANQAPLSVRGWWEVSIPLISSITVFALATKLLSCNTACLTYTGLQW